MTKNKKSDSVTMRLPDELRRYEAYGFDSMTEFVKTALHEFVRKNEVEVTRANDIIKSLLKLIQVMESDRDYNHPEESYPAEKAELLAALYAAAKPIANAKMMLDHPVNWIDYPEELKEDGFDNDEKHYVHTWAR